MSVNQSRGGDKNEFKRSGRSGNPNSPRNFPGVGGRGGGGGGGSSGTTTAPPSGTNYYTGNKSFKKVVGNNAQGAQNRGPGSNLNVNSNYSSGGGRGAPNGAHNQPSLRGTPDVSSTGAPAKLADASVQKSSPGLPKAPQSRAASHSSGTTDATGSTTPVKGSGDASRAFQLQFGSISPGVMNGMQVPARTNSAPPNLDEQKRAQARLDSLKAAASYQNQAAPKQHLPRKDTRPVDQPNVAEAPPTSRDKKEVLSSAPPVTVHSQKPTGPPVPSVPGVSMQMPFPQSQIHLPFGGPNPPLQSQPMVNTSLTVPLPMHISIGNPSQVPPQVFVPSIQHHQGIIHQSQGLTFPPQMGPQLGNMGIGMGLGPQYPQQSMGNMNFVGSRRTVKITHPDTHEELRLDKRTDGYLNGGTSGSRPHPHGPPQSQAVPSFPSSHPMNYYSNSYNPSPVYFPSHGGTQSTSGSQAPRFYNQPSKQVTVKPAVSHVEKVVVSTPSIEKSDVTKSQKAVAEGTSGQPHKDAETNAGSSLPQLEKSDVTKSQKADAEGTSGQPHKDSETNAGSSLPQLEKSDITKSQKAVAEGTSGQPHKDSETSAGSSLLQLEKSDITKSQNAVAEGTSGQPHKDSETNAGSSLPQLGNLEDTVAAPASVEDCMPPVNSLPEVAKETAVDRSRSLKEEQKQPGKEVFSVPVDKIGGQSSFVSSLSVGHLDSKDSGVQETSKPSTPSMETSNKVVPSNVADESVSRCESIEKGLDSTEIIGSGTHPDNPPKEGEPIAAAVVVPEEQVKDSADQNQDSTVSDATGAQQKEPVNDIDDKSSGSISTSDHGDQISNLDDHSNKFNGKDVDQINNPVTLNEESPAISLSVPGAPSASEVEATGSISPSSSKVKGNSSKASKKRKDILKNADARGTTSDLYNAYKRPEEKKETSSAFENPPVNSSEKEVLSDEKRGPTKFEPDDWEDAADISTPKMETGLKHHSEDDNEGMTKKYSRDFLLKFSDHCTDLPVGFEKTPEITEVMSVSGVNMVRDSYPSPGRGGNREMQVHKEAAQQRQAQANRLASGPSSNPTTRRAQMDFGPKGSNVLPSTPQMGGYRGLPQQIRACGNTDPRLDTFKNRPLSVPLSAMGDDTITLGSQGGLARGMSVRGQTSMQGMSLHDMDSRRGVAGPSSYGSIFERAGYGQEDLAGRGFGQVLPSSPPELPRVTTPLQSGSLDKVMSEERLHDMSILMIKEFYSARDEKEVALCIRDLNAPSFNPSMISIWVIDSFERKDVDRESLTKLLINLAKSRDGILSQDSLVRGFKSVLSTLEDAVLDAPKAAEFLGRIFAKVLLENVIPYTEVWRLIYEGGEEQGRLVEIGLAAEVLGVILEIIKSEKGDSFLHNMPMGSDLRLENFRPPTIKKTLRLDKFIWI